jgi:hypothetical protein
VARKWSADLNFALAMVALAILSLIWALFGFVGKSLAQPDRGRSSSLRWSRRVVGLGAGLLLLAVRGASVLTAITNANFRTACDAWIANPATAATTWGAISEWDTAAVSNMAQVWPVGVRRMHVRPPLLPHVSSVCDIPMALDRVDGDFCHNTRIGAATLALRDAARGGLAGVLRGNSVQPKPRRMERGLGHDSLTGLLPCSPSRARACVWGCGLAFGLASGAWPLVSGAWAGVAPPEAAVLAPVPCGPCAMRRAVGSQAFTGAEAFNQNLGAWNVARVTDLSGVCSPAARRVRVRACGAVGWPLVSPRALGR